MATTVKSSTGVPDQAFSSKLTPEGDYIPTEAKYNSCVFVIYCPQHQKMAVSQSDKAKASWLPFVPLPDEGSWEDAARAGALMVLSQGETKEGRESLQQRPPFDRVQCMEMLRIQMPHTLGFVTRFTYYMQLAVSDTFNCCRNSSRIKWFALNQVLNSEIDYLWGHELAYFGRQILSPISQRVFEYCLDEAFLYVPRDPPRNPEEGLLKSIHITEKDVERLYSDFIEHCFPSFSQTFESFKAYMAKYGFEKSDHRLLLLFQAFNASDTGYLSFHELLIGLATIEPSAAHSETRTKFIFRYYSGDSSGMMAVDKFRMLVRDLNPNAPSQEIEQKVVEGMRIIGTKSVNGVEHICVSDFFHAIGSRKFRGTSNVCRSSVPIFSQISRSTAYRTLKKLTSRQSMGSIIRPPLEGDCVTCKEKNYKLATHSVLIDSEGKVVDSIQVVENEPAEPGCFTAGMYSAEIVFNKQSAANVMRKLIHQFNKVKGTNKEAKGLLTDRPDQLFHLAKLLTTEVELLLDEEDKCPRVISPCYIIGDIHGNLEDLLSLERSIWKRIPCLGANYLFLGDYVDRGKWSLECALYIMALKSLMPNKVTMLRGNHEVRSLQAHYSYRAECITKYGEDYGLKIWDLTNRVFDKLPLAAVVDDAIYCAHGGIPKSAQTIAQINTIRKDLSNPETESSIAWEILWSDPCHAQQFNDVCNLYRLNPKEQGGFVYNVKRNTAFLFNETAVNGFLKQNGLTHIVRAHEVPLHGFLFHFGNKCTTIFSCSHYCGNDNACSCVLADNQVLRIIRLDTVNNGPATD